LHQRFRLALNLSFQLKVSLKIRVSATGFPRQFMRLASLVICILAFAAAVAAQSGSINPRTGQPNTQPDLSLGSIRGRVVLPNGSPLNTQVKVILLSLRGTRDITLTDNQGQFEFHSLPPAQYTIEVEADKLLFEISSERAQVFGGAASVVNITLKEKTSSARNNSGSNVISVGEIGKDVPDKAKKEFERASKLSDAGKALEAIDHLRKAIAIYPNFMMAHNDLGAQLLEQGNLDEAATELHRAIELDPKAFNPYLNLGIVLIRQKKFTEAADTLRKSLSLMSDSPAAKLYLGLALMNKNDFGDAERELKAAYHLGGTVYSDALFYLGELYMRKGERKLARQAFEDYLHDEPSNATNAAQARKLIGTLQ
jgi:Tfp pilus assembly protein PilF